MVENRDTWVKLTDSQDRTYDNTQWGENITHRGTPGSGPLCSPYWIHFYRHPLFAALFNPLEAGFTAPHAWTIMVGKKVKHEATKSGAKTLTTLQRMELPEISLAARVRFGILATQQMIGSGGDPEWDRWAEEWLSRRNRSVIATPHIKRAIVYDAEVAKAIASIISNRAIAFSNPNSACVAAIAHASTIAAGVAIHINNGDYSACANLTILASVEAAAAYGYVNTSTDVLALLQQAIQDEAARE